MKRRKVNSKPAAARARTKPPAASPPIIDVPPTEPRIWETSVTQFGSMTQIGLLVAVPDAGGKLGRLIAICWDDRNYVTGGRRDAMRLAKMIAGNPGIIDREPGQWFDLRKCDPLPTWMYAAVFNLILDDGGDDPKKCVTGDDTYLAPPQPVPAPTGRRVHADRPHLRAMVTTTIDGTAYAATYAADYDEGLPTGGYYVSTMGLEHVLTAAGPIDPADLPYRVLTILRSEAETDLFKRVIPITGTEGRAA